MPCTWRAAYTDNKCGSQYVNETGYCKEHDQKCLNCGEQADHGCDFCGQFVCGYPACEKCGGCRVDHGGKEERSKNFRNKQLAVKLRAIIEDKDMPPSVKSQAIIELALL